MQGPLLKTDVAAVVLLSITAAIAFSYLAAPRLPVSFTANGRAYNFTSVASSSAQRERGLMNATVTNSTFMLFVFPSPYRWSFWMKNTHYPLDMIWIDGGASGGNVVYIKHDAIPCVSYDPSQFNCTIYLPPSVADYVIEARAGFANSSGITNGSYVSFDYRG